MNIDISAISRMVRRFDTSATFKNFVAVFAILSVPVNLHVIHAFIVDAIVMGFGLWEPDDYVFLAATIALAFIAAVMPLGFILWDWVARQPWRSLAAINAALLGGGAFSALAFAFGLTVNEGLEELVDLEAGHRLALAATLVVVFAWLVIWLGAKAAWVYRLLITVACSAGLALVILAIAGVDDEYPLEDTLTEIGSGVLGLAVYLMVPGWLVWRAIRNRVVLSSNVPRQLLLGAIHQGGFWGRVAFLAGLPSSLWNLQGMKTLAFWAFLLARPIFYSGIVLLLSDAWQGYGVWVQVAAALVLIATAHAVFYFAKRLAARYPWNPQNSAEQQQPILFLRSFEDDQLTFRRRWWRLGERWLQLWSFRSNVDEAMVDEIAQYGPLVALGMPGEEKVPFGASRYYSSHDDWQEIITHTAKRARAIVIVAGDTPGVRWEFEFLASEGLLDRTLVLFPPGDANSASHLLSIYQHATKSAAVFNVPEGRNLIALLPGPKGALIVADQARASAYVTALRGFFQKQGADELAAWSTIELCGPAEPVVNSATHCS